MRAFILDQKMSQKNYGVIILCIIFFIIVIQGCHVAASPGTSVGAGSISLYPNETGSVPVTVKEISLNGGLGAYDVKVTFDPAVIQVLDVTGGSSPFNSITAKNINNVAGEVRFNHFITATQGPTGTITVAYLSVKAVGGAGSSTSLGVTVYSLVDAETGNEITPRSTTSGSVTVKTPKSPSTITITLSKSTLTSGETITFSGAISPARSTTVTLSLTRPDSSQITRTTSSGGNGSYTYVFTPDMAGNWSVNAAWSGDESYSGASSSTKTFTVTKLSSTITVSVSPATIRPGETVRIRGLLNPSVSSVMVTIEYRIEGGTWASVTSVLTNGTGGYSYEWTAVPTGSGRYQVRASWQGNSVYQGAQSTTAYFNVAENSVLSISLSSISTAINDQIVIRGQVSPIHEYVNVTISIEAPNGTILVKVTQTDAAGNYRINFVPDASGVWSFKASWLGDVDTLGCESQEVTLTVTTLGSTISLGTSTSSLLIGSSIRFFGRIEPSPGMTTVTLILTSPDSNIVTLQTASANNGSFSLTYWPYQTGTWLAQASWQGNTNYGGSTSSQVSFVVEKRSSSLTLSCNPPIPTKGELVVLDGVLTPHNVGNTINVLMSEDGGRTWSSVSSCTTSAEGAYSTSWRANRIGTFTFKSEWAGDDEYSGCISNTLTFVVQEEVTSQQVTLPNNEVAEVVSSTNSSSISLTVDAENGRIEANVTGQSGTTGVTNIFVPQGLLESYDRTINDLVFTVDGVPVTPEIIKVSGGYLVTLRYGHSMKLICIHYFTYSLSVSVLDYDNVAVANANVVLDGPEKTSCVTDSSGMAYFPHLPKGEYVIEVYYGPVVGGDSVNIDENKAITVSTVVGQLQAEYTQLQTEKSALETQLNTVTMIMYVFASATIASLVSIIYFAKKRKS
jgi:hypothetical protein